MFLTRRMREKKYSLQKNKSKECWGRGFIGQVIGLSDINEFLLIILFIDCSSLKQELDYKVIGQSFGLNLPRLNLDACYGPYLNVEMLKYHS